MIASLMGKSLYGVMPERMTNYNSGVIETISGRQGRELGMQRFADV